MANIADNVIALSTAVTALTAQVTALQASVAAIPTTVGTPTVDFTPVLTAIAAVQADLTPTA